jgi:hypothetical protein
VVFSRGVGIGMEGHESERKIIRKAERERLK